ncbi:hypothetical protein [Paludisphaera mucosa]|uniref:Uncharacterized protein n=1 Tax=Paludisphaera mucosa TaxID=3030827 RepID=A0ABT6FIQ2_9BACT|nr:hypothetical protein [Paludisphaera mucosa]MDG3007452.1 hypothetical protein [Paludisphaera mucosa]
MHADFADFGPPKNLTSRARRFIFLGLLAPFTVLTYLAVSSGSPGDVRDRPVALTTLATITGPFIGAIARNGQPCCLQSSLRLAAVCGPALALGLTVQVVAPPFGRGRRAVRLAFWAIGWFVWLLGGHVSFMHALS